MRKQQLFKLAAWITSICIVLTVILMIHIYLVTRPVDFGANKTIQMSRIDFKQVLDTNEVKKIREFVQHLPGVKHTLFNMDNGVFIFTYANDQQSSLNVYNKLMAHGHYKAERFVIPASQAGNGCPVMNDKNSFGGKLTGYITHLFN